MPDPRPTPDPAATAWARVRQYSESLFDALEALDEAGGFAAAEKAMSWSPKARIRAVDSLKQIKLALDRQLGAIKAGG